jgi:hypothetical protein
MHYKWKMNQMKIVNHPGSIWLDDDFQPRAWNLFLWVADVDPLSFPVGIAAVTGRDIRGSAVVD